MNSKLNEIDINIINNYLLKDINKYYFTVVYEQLTKILINTIEKNDFCKFITNNYENITEKSKIIIIWYVYLEIHKK